VLQAEEMGRGSGGGSHGKCMARGLTFSGPAPLDADCMSARPGDEQRGAGGKFIAECWVRVRLEAKDGRIPSSRD
jgi:hypothetical protein